MSNYCECYINIYCEWCHITEQNKRYREVLEYYRDNMHVVPNAFIKAGLYHPIMEDKGDKARKALEES